MMTWRKRIGGFLFDKLGIYPGYPVIKPMNPGEVEILADEAFQRSCREVKRLTLLDTPRLANLWSLCRMSNPQGNIIEVGTYRGGGALHLHNSCPERKIIVCDSFAGFEATHPTFDTNFSKDMFTDTSVESVRGLFESRGCRYEVIAGFFPGSCGGRDLRPISFAHLDVDTYKATIESLDYLAGCATEKSLIVLDDYFHRADGVVQAVREFAGKNADWRAFPLFPGQGMLIHKSWFE